MCLSERQNRGAADAAARAAIPGLRSQARRVYRRALKDQLVMEA
jgi:hypothetical protein